MTPRDAREAREREAVLTQSSVICECGHHLSWHGEDYAGGCSHEGCECSHNAAQAYAHGSLDPEPLDAYVRTVRATTDAQWAEKVRAACEALRTGLCAEGKHYDLDDEGMTRFAKDTQGEAVDAALAALLARLGLAPETTG